MGLSLDMILLFILKFRQNIFWPMLFCVPLALPLLAYRAHTYMRNWEDAITSTTLLYLGLFAVLELAVAAVLLKYFASSRSAKQRMQAALTEYRSAFEEVMADSSQDIIDKLDEVLPPACLLLSDVNNSNII